MNRMDSMKEVMYLPSPQNLNIFWNLGSMLGLVLVLQVFTGVLLSMHYSSDVSHAFESVIHIMRDVPGGWMLRTMHANGASIFFLLLYIHIGRGLYYQSYKTNPLVWLSGCTLYVLCMAAAFLGYVLPWGQMSLWGATVITNFISAIPYVGGSVVEWVWGGYSVGQPTLSRFYSLHFLLPMVIMMMVIVHIVMLHEKGSSNPLGCMSHLHKVTFHPYFSWKDMVGFLFLFMMLIILVFYFPYTLNDPENFIPANSLVTPVHIMPEWYFLFAYAMLRAVPTKLGGVMILIFSILILFLLPLCSNKPVLPSSFNPLHQICTWLFFSYFLLLTWLGSCVAEEPYTGLSYVMTLFYFTSLLNMPYTGEEFEFLVFNTISIRSYLTNIVITKLVFMVKPMLKFIFLNILFTTSVLMPPIYLMVWMTNW
uniref:Cytochrome b n=2 Tax=unclassified Physidae TaxID=1724862 RepID=A0A8F8SQZ4_9GAST|nr:cytochrome b [Physidae sp. PE4]QYB18830.1 cytochrome b [Physidae sp. P3S_19]